MIDREKDEEQLSEGIY